MNFALAPETTGFASTKCCMCTGSIWCNLAYTKVCEPTRRSVNYYNYNDKDNGSATLQTQERTRGFLFRFYIFFMTKSSTTRELNPHLTNEVPATCVSSAQKTIRDGSRRREMGLQKCLIEAMRAHYTGNVFPCTVGGYFAGKGGRAAGVTKLNRFCRSEAMSRPD